MAGRGRNQRCECGSGRKVKFCCGVRRGPSDSEMAKAFLAGLIRPAARTLLRFSDEELDELHAETLELPCLDWSMQVRLPRLVTPELNALMEAIRSKDVDAVEDVLPAALARVDTPLERARLARAVIGLRDAGRITSPVAAMAVLDLASQERSSLLASGLAQSAAVALGEVRTPGGLLVAV